MGLFGRFEKNSTVLIFKLVCFVFRLRFLITHPSRSKLDLVSMLLHKVWVNPPETFSRHLPLAPHPTLVSAPLRLNLQPSNSPTTSATPPVHERASTAANRIFFSDHTHHCHPQTTLSGVAKSSSSTLKDFNAKQQQPSTRCGKL